MLPTQLLMDEHRVIEQVLTCLEAMTAEARSAGKLDGPHARDAVAFFRAFADQCHHGKEESQLFPLLESKGFSPEEGPTGVMRREHDLGRGHVRAMNEAIEGAAQGDAGALNTFADHALAYVHLLRDHIGKEDQCLFPMANQALGEADQQALLAKFQHVEEEEMGAGTHEKFLAIADELADHYHVARAQTTPGHEGCGCHHHH
jgi:hemerythrin-like domain-containing protein